VRFDVLTAVKMSIFFFWVVRPSGLAGGGSVTTYKTTGVRTQKTTTDIQINFFPIIF
jgi:hypothetical protein